jgi:hypothetical protein
LKDIDPEAGDELLYYRDEVIPLCTYDLKIRLEFERFRHIKTSPVECQKFFSILIADRLCAALQCETAVVENYETIIDRYLFIDKD